MARSKFVSESEKEKIEFLFEQGATVEDACHLTGRSESTIYRIANNQLKDKILKKPKAKLSKSKILRVAEQAARLQRKEARHVSLKEIGGMLGGCCSKTVSR